MSDYLDSRDEFDILFLSEETDEAGQEEAQDSHRLGADQGVRQAQGQEAAQGDGQDEVGDYPDAEGLAALRENEGRCPSCGQEHDTNGGNLAFPDLQDAIEVNKGVLEEMPGTGAHTVWDEGMVDSALHRPQQRAVYDEDADVFDMAADLAHGVVQNHGFEKGNPRTAHILTHAFLENNGFAHVVGEDDYELARHILGYTSHGQAKNEGEAHTPAETAQVFRDRHAKHLAGEDVGIKPYERKEANIPHPKHEVDSPILFEHLDGDYHNFYDEVFGNLLSKGH